MDGWMDGSQSTCALIMLEHFQAVRDCGSRRLLTMREMEQECGRKKEKSKEMSEERRKDKNRRVQLKSNW